MRLGQRPSGQSVTPAYVGRRPTRWVVLRIKSEGLRLLMSAAGRRDVWCSGQSRRRYGPSSYRAQRALPFTAFSELEPLCRPQADAMGGAPSKVEGVTAPPAIGRSAPSRSLRSRSWSLYVGRRPTRWVVLRAKSKRLRPLQLSCAVRPPAHCVLGAGASMSAAGRRSDNFPPSCRRAFHFDGYPCLDGWTCICPSILVSLNSVPFFSAAHEELLPRRFQAWAAVSRARTCFNSFGGFKSMKFLSRLVVRRLATWWSKVFRRMPRK